VRNAYLSSEIISVTVISRIQVPYSKFNFALLRTPSVHYCSHKRLLFFRYSEPDEFTSLIKTLLLQDHLPPHPLPHTSVSWKWNFLVVFSVCRLSSVQLKHFSRIITLCVLLHGTVTSNCQVPLISHSHYTRWDLPLLCPRVWQLSPSIH